MMQYRVVDMSNNKYIIKGISLGKNINSYFCMNKGNLIKEIVIVDKDITSVLDGQIVFSLKNVLNEWINHMIYSFCHLLMENKYDLKNMKFDINLENQLLKSQIEEFLIKMGVYNRNVEVKKEDNDSVEGNVFKNEKESVLEEFKPKENLLFYKENEDEKSKEYVDMVSEFDVGMINDNEYEEVEEVNNSGKVGLSMTLFLMSIFLFVASLVLYVKM